MVGDTLCIRNYEFCWNAFKRRDRDMLSISRRKFVAMAGIAFIAQLFAVDPALAAENMEGVVFWDWELLSTKLGQFRQTKAVNPPD